jgi:hypothetical protein
MKFFDPLAERAAFLKHLTPRGLRTLAGQRLSDVVRTSIPRSRRRVGELAKRYPGSSPRELAQRLIDNKKEIASMVGGVSGMFGLAAVPADLLLMSWLQLILLVDIATLYRVNLKTERTRKELLELFAYANGIGPLQRASPKVLGKVVGKLLERRGLETVGRVLPLVAVPLTAYLNHQHIQATGDHALRYYHGFLKAQEKAKRSPGTI